MATTLKIYDTLPVVVVEDHNEALPHIYRSIGSKYLPLSGITLLHLDSHPDMLLPVTMPADQVYNKHQLFESLSIENWILPAVYAGHISHIVWIKPPWCGQIQDQVTEFYVGKCTKTGTIRTTCTESYFLSETLYVPESQLDNKKKLKFTSITLSPRDWECSRSQENSHVENSQQAETTFDQACKNLTVEITEQEPPKSKHASHCGDPSDIVTGEKDCDKSATKTDTECKRSADSNCYEQENTLPKKVKASQEDDLDEGADKDTEKFDRAEIAEKFTSPTVDVLKDLEKELESGPYVLDIDLDFFSTMNPFKDMYGEKQYKILQELYRFTRLQGKTEQDIVECVRKREKQLSNMKKIFSKLDKDPQAEIEHERSDLIKTLVCDLQTSRPGSVDFDLLHEAGCTCDDTELPHHVSTCPQISLLVDTVQEFLSYLKKPTYITVARSSSDDYCPPNQVDMIQDSVLDLLQQLYQEISVTMDYQNEEDVD